MVTAWMWWAACSGDGPKDKDVPDGDADTDVDSDSDVDVDVDCADLDAGSTVPFVRTGNTVGGGADLLGSCGGAGEELTVAFRAPAAGDYLFDTHLSTADTVVYVLAGCGGAELGCNSDDGLGFASHLVVSLAADQPVLIVVDGEAGGGPFVLTGTAVAGSELDCADGFDDDADQQVDCLDSDCAGDPSCAGECPELTASGSPSSVAGSTTGAPDQVTPSCGVGPSSDRSVLFEAPADGRYGFALSTADTPFDSVLVLLDGCGGAELGCVDNNGGFGGEALAVDLLAGEQVVAVIDGYGGDYGPFTLAVFTPEASETDCGDGVDQDLDGLPDCADPDCIGDASCVEDCANGLDDDGDALADCQDPDCQYDLACAEDCTDGVDQDLDGLVDCLDPGCDFDAACPEDCGNDTDDDEDGLTDCDDGACLGALECGGQCPDLELAAEGSISGTTTGASDVIAPSCGGPGSPDVMISFTPTVTATYVFDTFGASFDTVLALLSDCGGAEVACSDDAPGYLGPSQIAMAISAGDTVIAVVDGLEGYSGDFVLNVTRAPDSELDCADGLDEDYDGLTDCADPGCAGQDGCGTCPDDVLSGSLPIVETGTTSGASAFDGSCGYGTSPDHSFAFTAPGTGTYSFSSAGSTFDTVLYVLDACGGVELGCNDDSGGSTSEVQLALTNGQTVIVVVDGYGGAAGDYTLTVQ